MTAVQWVQHMLQQMAVHDTGWHCTAWDCNLTPAVRGKTVSTVTAVSAYTVHVPRMTAEGLYAAEKDALNTAKWAINQLCTLMNYDISDMHLSRVGSHSKSLQIQTGPLRPYAVKWIMHLSDMHLSRVDCIARYCPLTVSQSTKLRAQLSSKA